MMLVTKVPWPAGASSSWSASASSTSASAAPADAARPPALPQAGVEHGGGGGQPQPSHPSRGYRPGRSAGSAGSQPWNRCGSAMSTCSRLAAPGAIRRRPLTNDGSDTARRPRAVRGRRPATTVAGHRRVVGVRAAQQIVRVPPIRALAVKQIRVHQHAPAPVEEPAPGRHLLPDGVPRGRDGKHPSVGLLLRLPLLPVHVGSNRYGRQDPAPASSVNVSAQLSPLATAIAPRGARLSIGSLRWFGRRSVRTD